VTRVRCITIACGAMLAMSSFAAAAQAPRPGQPTAAPRPASPSPDASRPVAPTAILRGRITAADTGKPLRRARVTLVPLVQAVGQLRIAASTNSQGRYELKDVPAGAYRVSAMRAGYVTFQYGQRRSLEPGRTVELRGGQSVERIDIALPRGGVMAGRITDETGEPFPGVRVEATASRYIDGRRVPYPVGSTTTDDLGEFRISGLQAGTYALIASSREMWLNEQRQVLGYAFTFFPGSPGNQAEPIELVASQERTDLSFKLSSSRTARISGIVQRDIGLPVDAQSVFLAPEFRGTGLTAAGGIDSMNTRADGAFEFRDVPPGQYLLRVGGQTDVAQRHLDVTGDDIGGLVLAMRRGSTIRGSVVSEDGTLPPFAPGRLRMSPVAADPDKVLDTNYFLPSRDVKPDWSFEILNVAGPYLLRVDGLPDDWMLKAVRLDDREITDTPLDIPTGGKDINGAQVVLTKRVGNVSGDVRDANGKAAADATVIVFTEDSKLWGPGSRFVKMTRPANDGRFSVSGLPEGTYRAIARSEVVDGQWEDPAFLDSVYQGALRFVLIEGGSATITVSVPR
jgi:hypothetical protein